MSEVVAAPYVPSRMCITAYGPPTINRGVHMCVKLIRQVFELGTVIPSTQKLVLVTICYHAREATNYTAWPSMAVIAKETGLHRDSVKRSIRWLIQHGYLQKLSTGNYRGKTNTYYVVVDKLANKGCTQHPPTPKGVHCASKGVQRVSERGAENVHNSKEPLLTVGETENTDNSEAVRKLKGIAKRVAKNKALH